MVATTETILTGALRASAGTVGLPISPRRGEACRCECQGGYHGDPDAGGMTWAGDTLE